MAKKKQSGPVMRCVPWDIKEGALRTIWHYYPHIGKIIELTKRQYDIVAVSFGQDHIGFVVNPKANKR